MRRASASDHLMESIAPSKKKKKEIARLKTKSKISVAMRKEVLFFEMVKGGRCDQDLNWATNALFFCLFLQMRYIRKSY